MPRTVKIVLPSEKTGQLIEEIKALDGLLGLSLQKEGSLQPKGDIISLEVTDRSLNRLMQLMEKRHLFDNPEVVMTTTQPLSITAKGSLKKTSTDVSEAIWEEMVSTISRQSNMTVNNLIIMFISGVLAVIGIVTNALHIVVGAMVIAPGFLPVVRISLGLIARSIDWRNGLKDTAKAYACLFIGAGITTVVLQALGKPPLGGEPSYLPSGVLLSYWTTIKVPSVLVTIVASITGAIIIATHRSVLTAGVMIALALVPAASVVAMGVFGGDLTIALKGLLRWLLEVGTISLFSCLVFMWKKASVHQRNMKE